MRLANGHALTYAFDRKYRQAGEECQKEGVKFLPLPVETLGGWHKNALKVITKLAHQLARHTGSIESETVSHLYQSLSVSILLMKGNAALILSRDYPPQIVDGVVDS